jgi:pimeloyl-ACP methyl ester carboxylesterase
MKHEQPRLARRSLHALGLALCVRLMALSPAAPADPGPAEGAGGEAVAASHPSIAPAERAAAEATPTADPTTEPPLPSGQRPAAPLEPRRKQGVPTLGGMQLWTDLVVFHGWRIQRHAVTGHCRLLDEQDRRWESGSFSQCRATLDAQRQALAMPPLDKRVVILTHGLFGTRLFLHEMERYLAERGEFEVLTWGYASTRGDIDEHAEALAGMIEALEGVEEISFVAHSMGGLVVRRYLAMGPSGTLPDARIRRLVMLGTPNQGAARARLWASDGVVGEVFGLVAGRAAEQLSSDWEATAARLAVPPCEFGILAGGRGDGMGWHQGIPGDDDGMVGVDETRLDGAAEHLVLPVTHRGLLRDPRAMECTLRFLQRGSFVEPAAKDDGP